MSKTNNANKMHHDMRHTNATKSFLLDFVRVLTKGTKAFQRILARTTKAFPKTIQRNAKNAFKQLFIPLCALFASLSLQGCFDIKIKTQTPSVGYYSLPSVVAPKECPSFLPMRLEVEVASEFNTTNIFIEGKNGRIEPLKDAQWLDLPSNLIKTSLEAKAQSQCIALSSTNVDSKIPLLQVRVFSFGIAKDQNQEKENLSASVNMSLRLSQASTQASTKSKEKNELNSNIHTKVEVAQHSAKNSDEQILATKNALDKALDESIKRVNDAIKKD